MIAVSVQRAQSRHPLIFKTVYLAGTVAKAVETLGAGAMAAGGADGGSLRLLLRASAAHHG